MLYVRYKFESNSQLDTSQQTQYLRCVCYTLDTSLKAIHNGDKPRLIQKQDVYAIR